MTTVFMPLGGTPFYGTPNSKNPGQPDLNETVWQVSTAKERKVRREADGLAADFVVLSEGPVIVPGPDGSDEGGWVVCEVPYGSG